MALFNKWIHEFMSPSYCNDVFFRVIVKIIETHDLSLIKETFEEFKIDLKKLHLDSDESRRICYDIRDDLAIFEYLVSKGLRADNVTSFDRFADPEKQRKLVNSRVEIYLKYGGQLSEQDELELTKDLTYEQVYDKLKVVRHQATKNAGMCRGILNNNGHEVRKWYFDGACPREGVNTCFRAAIVESKETEEGAQSKSLVYFKFLDSKGAKPLCEYANLTTYGLIHFHRDIIEFLKTSGFYDLVKEAMEDSGTPEEKQQMREFYRKYNIYR